MTPSRAPDQMGVLRDYLRESSDGRLPDDLQEKLNQLIAEDRVARGGTYEQARVRVIADLIAERP